MRELTNPMASPRTHTRAWSAMDSGFVKKKKASVMWKREMEVKMVFADMSAMIASSAVFSDCSSAAGQVLGTRSGDHGGCGTRVRAAAGCAPESSKTIVAGEIFGFNG